MATKNSFSSKELKERIFSPFKLISQNPELQFALSTIQSDTVFCLGKDFAEAAEVTRHALFALDDVIYREDTEQYLKNNSQKIYSIQEVKDIFNAANSHLDVFLKFEHLPNLNIPDGAGIAALCDAITLLTSPEIRKIQQTIRERHIKNTPDQMIPQSIDTNDSFSISCDAPFAKDEDFDRAAARLTELRDSLIHG